MHTRRDALALSLASLALAGCNPMKSFADPRFEHAVIDMHGHLFNGTDVPAVGFVEQVVLRDPHSEIGSPALLTPVVRLLVFILREAAPTAGEELAQIRSSDALAAAMELPGRADAGDEAAVARALANYKADVQTRAAAQPIGGGDPAADDKELLDLLGVDVSDQDGAAAPTLGPPPPETEAAARIYEQDAVPRSYRRRSAVFQAIRWAGLLTRPRARITREYISLYAGDARVNVLSPSVLDFELWFRADETLSPQRDQIEVNSEIAKRTQNLLLLNFIQFCPLRAALETAAGRDPLALVKLAVERRGFAGVKLYPPLGYRPIANPPGDQFGGKVGQRVSGDRIDAALTALYDWCLRREVPIKAHANNSNDAGVCTGRFGSPVNWAPVLERWRGLRLNLAHFGGFDESRGDAACDAGGIDWEDRIAALAPNHPGLYADLGYWTASFAEGSRERRRVRDAMRALLEGAPGIGTRLMFGSDWSMIAKEPTQEIYVAEVLGAVRDVGLDPRRVFRDNAVRYLGLDRDGLQRERLERFFGADRLNAALADRIRTAQ